MRAFTEPLTQLQGYEELEQAVQKTEGVILVSGCIDAVKPHIVYSVHNGSGSRIIVTFHEQKAKELLEEYRFFDRNVAYYPAKDILFYQSDIRGNVLTSERINALKMMAEEKECTIITTFDGLMNPMPAPEKFIQAVKKISVGDTVELNELTRHLVELGYEKNYQAETMGEFSVRGGIIDIFPLTEETPFRIELWGDEVDSIRSFDPESQRSIENLEEIYIYPACELVLTEEERRNGVAKIQKEAEKAAEKFRKEMKTEEAYRVKSMADQIAEETMEYGITAGLDAYLSYFCKPPTVVEVRPKVLEADVVRFQNNKEKWVAFVGLLDGHPYEIFTGLQDDDEGILLPKSVTCGRIIKNVDEDGTKRYDFQFENKRGYKTTIEGLSEKFNKEYWNYAKLISGVLRYRMPIEQVIKLVGSLQLNSESINTWKNGVERALKKYIQDGTEAKGKKCPNCGNETLVYQEGCLICTTCGASRCG